MPKDWYMNPNDYSEISIEIFLGMTGQVPFDVYIQLSSEKFTKVCHRNEAFDRARINNYLNKGVKNLFILRKDRREYIAATERFIRVLVAQKEYDHQKASQAFEELTEQTMFEMFDDQIFDEVLFRRAQDITKSYVDTLKKDPRLLSNIIQLCRNETYMVRHSISTSVFAILIARAAGSINDKVLQIIGLGGLLHDVGMSALAPEISDMDRKLNPEEWAQIKTHPKVGSSIAAGGVKDFPEEIIQVIEQHHENYDGSGYPRGLYGDEIYYPARIVAIADCFSALTAKRGGRALYSPEQAIALMQTDRHRYDPKLLKAFSDLMRTGQKKKAG